MKATLFLNFAKRENSTLIPEDEGGFDFDVTMKDDVDILNPVLKIQETYENLVNYTYAHWLGRYYFVDTITTLTNSICELHLRNDALATYKSEILNYSAFVERAYEGFDVFIEDYAISQRYESIISDGGSGSITGFSPDGCYVVRTIGKGMTTSGVGISSYALTSAQLSALLDFMFTDSNFDFLADTVVKSFFNPFQYIVSVQWFPLAISNFGTGSETVKFGFWDSGVEAVPVQKDGIILSVNMAVPQSRFEDFRKFSSLWTQIHLLIPGVGFVSIEPSLVRQRLYVSFTIDFATGDLLVRINPADRDFLINTFSGKIGVPIEIGQIAIDVASTAGNFSTALSELFKGDIGGAVSGVVQGVTNVLQPTPSIKGVPGNIQFLKNQQQIEIYRLEYKGAETPNTTYGRPVMRNIQLSELTGYVQCAKASVPLTGFLTEKEQVNTWLNSGFYIE